MMIDDSPCKITAYSTAKPGKHGSAKARIDAQGVFDSKKRSLSQPVDAKIWVPMIERKQGQVVSVESDNVAQIMDLETYETITMQIPDGTVVESGEELEYLEFENQRKIID